MTVKLGGELAMRGVEPPGVFDLARPLAALVVGGGDGGDGPAVALPNDTRAVWRRPHR